MALSDLEAAVALASPSVASTSSTTVDQALASAGAVANEGDLILVFGSFVTVEAALRSLQIATV